MKQWKKVVFVGCATTLLVGCSAIQSIQEKSITAEKLPNGRVVKMGLAKPTAAWGCRGIDMKMYRYGFKQRLDQKYGYNYLKQKALADAGKMKQKPNYVYLHMPDEGHVSGSFYQAGQANAQATFYQCKIIPKP